MNRKQLIPSLQDFNLVAGFVDRVAGERGISRPSLAFCFFSLDLLLDLQEDEIEESMTDTTYLSDRGDMTGHDRGIDAVFIDEGEIPPVVHLFNFKYAEKLETTAKNFPANEIDKIISFIRSLLSKDEQIVATVNRTLYSKVAEIWNLFQSHNPRFEVHLCANRYYGLEEQERKRFERELGTFSNMAVRYHLMDDYVERLTRQGKREVNARLRAIDKNLFEKADGDVRALIVDIDGRDLLRIVIDDEALRSQADCSDYSVLNRYAILESAFEDNVRPYLKQRSKINRNIKETALSDEAHRFFYYNNGVTITCSHFDYPKQVRGPIIELENLQIVNGSQTIHALHEAFKVRPDAFENLDVLCRIYETRNEQLSTSIAEFTNSQNPVSSRDIRSNDFVQKKLERELEIRGYFYERKKYQHTGRPKAKRLDAEKVGQTLLTFVNKMPAEAKDKKRLIFAQLYDEIFTDNITADTVLLAVSLFHEIERLKLVRKEEILRGPQAEFEAESFITHASYYLLYVLSELAEKRGIMKSLANMDQIIALYPEAIDLIRAAVAQEREHAKEHSEPYTHRGFFKSNRAKQQLENLLGA